MITTQTRRCGRCQGVLDGDERACPHCGREQCPPVAEWPEGARKLLFLMVITDAVATNVAAGEQLQHEWLLENTMRGRYYRGRLLPRAASAADCYPEFIALLERWQKQGSPTDFAAIAQLRGGR